MLSEKVEKALNQQLNAETYSAYLYLSMSAYFKSINLDGFAGWMYIQALEELSHAKKFYDFIIQRGSRVVLGKIDAPPINWDSPLAVFENALNHEKKVTALIDDLVNLALEKKDHATNVFLQWFVTEQVEEEDNAGAVVEKLNLMGDSKGGLFMMDRELAKRGSGTTMGENGAD